MLIVDIQARVTVFLKERIGSLSFIKHRKFSQFQTGCFGKKRNRATLTFDAVEVRRCLLCLGYIYTFMLTVPNTKKKDVEDFVSATFYKQILQEGAKFSLFKLSVYN